MDCVIKIHQDHLQIDLKSWKNSRSIDLLYAKINSVWIVSDYVPGHIVSDYLEDTQRTLTYFLRLNCIANSEIEKIFLFKLDKLNEANEEINRLGAKQFQKEEFISDEELLEHVKSFHHEDEEISKEKQTIQVILDFSSLRDIIKENGGIILSTYKCPNCTGMVDIPESGKDMICKYCGTSIKPVDIFEKIKGLVSSENSTITQPSQRVKVNTPTQGKQNLRVLVCSKCGAKIKLQCSNHSYQTGTNKICNGYLDKNNRCTACGKTTNTFKCPNCNTEFAKKN